MKLSILSLCFLLSLTAYGQIVQDSTLKNRQDTTKLNVRFTDDVLLFNAGLKKDSSGIKGSSNLTISGYVDVYYGYYTDSTGVGGYEKFPTSAPRSGGFGLNIAQLTTRYAAEKVRGVITLHYGDIPQSAWSAQYNMIQEANMGFAFGKKIWLDGGFFRTHMGCESIQPRENMNIGLAITTYYEPYYLSGLKLSYQVAPKVMLQASVFNGFNTFVPVNHKKAYGLSAIYEVLPKLTTYFNVLVSDDAPENAVSKRRIYNDFFAVYKSKKLDAVIELNAGVQEHSQLSDLSQNAYMYSGTMMLKHKFRSNLAWFTRFEFFEDSDEIFTGPVYNENHQIVGINAEGFTLGFEVKPLETAYVRLEGRYLHLSENEKIFRYNNMYSNDRYECLAAMGFWF
jgi:hypothetical protein